MAGSSASSCSRERSRAHSARPWPAATAWSRPTGTSISALCIGGGSMVRVVLSSGFGVLLTSSAVFGGAWTWEQGHGQLVVTATPSSANEVFDGDRHLAPTP